jgi:hypothetical protein
MGIDILAINQIRIKSILEGIGNQGSQHKERIASSGWISHMMAVLINADRSLT